jgi:hypothetical protein
VSGFGNNTNQNLVVNASAARVISLTLDLHTYAGTSGVTILGGDGGTGSGLLIGSKNGDVIRGGVRADTIAGGGGADLLTGNGGGDTFRIAFSNAVSTNESSAGAADTITDFHKAASPTSLAGADRIFVSDAAGAITTTIAANGTGTAAGADWAVANGVLSFTGGTPVTTLAGALAVADAAAPAAGNAVLFVLGADAYIFEQNGANDVLVKLAGLAGIGGLGLSSGALFAF